MSKKITLILFIFLSFFLTNFASADSAPSVKPGATIDSLKDTDIQMKEEVVVIDIKEITDTEHYIEQIAHITATFKMFNVGEMKTIDVGFPLEDLQTLHLGDLRKPDNFKAFVNGIEQEIENVKLNEERYGDEWIAWKTTFEKGETELVVEYDITAHSPGYQGTSNYDYFLYYILETGAGWKGVIEKAEIIINFPDTFDVEKYQEYGFYSKEQPILSIINVSPNNYTIKGNQIKLLFENFEPTHDDNIKISFNSSEKYNNLIKALDKYYKEKQKDDSSKYELGKAYLAFTKCGGKGQGPHRGSYVSLADIYLQTRYLVNANESLPFMMKIADLYYNYHGCRDTKGLDMYGEHIVRLSKNPEIKEEIKIAADEFIKKYSLDKKDEIIETEKNTTDEPKPFTKKEEANNCPQEKTVTKNECASKSSIIYYLSYGFNFILLLALVFLFIKFKKNKR